MANVFIIVAAVTSSPTAVAVYRDVNFSKWTTLLEFSQIQNGHRRQEFKTAVTANHFSSTSPHRISCLTTLWRPPAPLGDTSATKFPSSPELASPSDSTTFEQFCPQITACHTLFRTWLIRQCLLRRPTTTRYTLTDQWDVKFVSPSTQSPDWHKIRIYNQFTHKKHNLAMIFTAI